MPSHYTHGPDYIKEQEKKKKKKKKSGLAAKLKARRDATNKAIQGM